ncbi:conserved hypothetical protein, partial [delta proteobacterium NaphS2]
MSEDRFKVLLLSDSHIGNPKAALDSLSVFDPLFTDIKSNFLEDKCPPSLIVFSGDLAYSGEKEQYELAEEFLKHIYECFDTEYGKIPILIVPGNHDVDRSVIDEAQKEYRTSLKASKVDDMMQACDVTWNHMIERQKNWRNFVESIPSQPWKFNENMHFYTGLLTFTEMSIGIVGFNSCWASHEKN